MIYNKYLPRLLGGRYFPIRSVYEKSIEIDLCGLYDENTILPTTVSTIWYDNENSKKLYNDLKNIIKRYSSNTVNGYMILKNAYNEKEQLRFATISVQSPKEYDLKV